MQNEVLKTMSAKKVNKPTRLQQTYRDQVIAALREQFGYKNVNQVPRLEKVVLNVGLGEAVQDSKVVDGAMEDLSKITGQRPTVRRARKAIANFKLRKGLPIGVAVTLRRDRMFEFVDRFFNVALPRVRDFRGVPRNAFDGQGNYTMGIHEQMIFPEIDLEKTKVRGLNISFVTSAKTDEEGRALLEQLGMPFRK